VTTHGGKRSRAALLAVIALGGCGFKSSPAESLTFQPPPGWQSSPGIFGFMQFWRPPTNDREVLMLFKSPRLLQPNEVFSDPEFQTTLKGATIERRTSIRICGTQPAEYLEARGTSSRDEEVRIEMVMTNAAGASFIATYVRPVAVPSDSMAEASLRELCPKR
jgi:hypothetical protein